MPNIIHQVKIDLTRFPIDLWTGTKPVWTAENVDPAKKGVEMFRYVEYSHDNFDYKIGVNLNFCFAHIVDFKEFSDLEAQASLCAFITSQHNAAAQRNWKIHVAEMENLARKLFPNADLDLHEGLDPRYPFIG